MELRHASLKDESTIAEWLQKEQDCLFTTGKKSYSTDMFKSWYEAHDQIGFIATNNNETLAYGEIWIDEEEQDLELAHLIVHPSQRDKGVGKELIGLLLEECRHSPYEWVYVRIEPDNSRAIQCYTGAGFKEDPSLRETFNSKWTWMKKRNH
ncbi:GNAT family N-acetyltransferase [Pontibacillus yanchengensis]|uniref:Acetyltransferase n=1 Tax=Pontibacillus yanchengensis Y32 TaxID=1385514 RepID=A0A0A2T606_9BACI|nr:GNAT family N-acetyltransferase [Pontibacillus yanchengensis]KGP71242.1 acetyltransferase [Pontibacillus yanchengensis Y32]